MYQTLLCLVSDQRMQNVLPLFQKGLHFDQVVLIASQDEEGEINPRFARIAQDMFNALGNTVDWNLHPTPVDPMDPSSTYQVCNAIISGSENSQHITINFTGGSKPMSIGAYQAGIFFQIPMLYVDTQAEQILHFYSGQLNIEPFNLNPISVTTLLKIHGKVVNEKIAENSEKPEFNQLAGDLFKRGDESIKHLIHIQEKLKLVKLTPEGECPVQSYNERHLPWLFERFEKLSMARHNGSFYYLDKNAISFITGGWLESYVFLAFQKSGLFMDAVCRLNLDGVENELDVACSVNGKLGVIECKSGSLKGKTGQSTLNRLHALKDTLGGTFGRAFLVTAASPAQLSDKFLNHASEYVSRVVCFDQLEKVAELVYSDLSNRKRS